MWHELIAAARRLRKDPWATGAALIALSLGIGLMTAVFALAYGIVLRPLPYRSPSRLAMIDASASRAQVPAWRERLGGFAQLAGYARGNFTVRGMGDPHPVPSAVVDGEFFDALGMPPLMGRVFSGPNEIDVVVISERLARQAASPQAMLGRSIAVGTAAVTIVGVMPDAFAFPDETTDIWIPAGAVPAIPLGEAADERRFQLFGRLRDGVPIELAREEFARARTALDPRARPSPGPGVALLRDIVTAPVRPALLALTASAVLVLLVACANVATIMIGRTIGRQRELAIRIAVGASRWRVFATTLAESGVISALGAVLGTALAVTAVRLIPLLGDGVMARAGDVRVDWRVLLFAAAIACASAACAAVPAMRVQTPDPAAFRDQGMTRRGARIRALLTASQIAVSMVLFIAAALLARTVATLLDRDIGIDAHGALVSQLMLTDAMSFGARAEGVRLRNVLDRVRAVPGVTAAGAGSSAPPNNGSLVMTVRLVTSTSETTTPELTVAAVTPGYLEAMGARLVRGRFFDSSDERGDALRVVLSAAAARALAPGHDPTGLTLDFSLPGLRQRGHPVVIGVVGDIAYQGLEFSPGPAVYVLWQELPASQMFLAVRTRGDVRAIAPAVRAALRDADPSLPVMPTRSMQAAIAHSISDRTQRALFGGGAALIAFAIAAIGLAGGLSRTIAERRRELAIRSALGATPLASVRLVMGEVAAIVGTGTCLGVAGGIAGARLLQSALYPVSPYDPIVIAAAAALVAVLSVAVCAVPARRAAAVDPIEVLRIA